MTTTRAIFAAVLSGILVAMGFPGFHFPTLSVGWVLPVAFTPLFFVLETLEPPRTPTAHGKERDERSTAKMLRRRAFFFTWIFGTTLALFAFFWCTYPAILFGKLPPWLAYPAFGLYCVLSGIYYPLVLLPFLWSSVRRAKHRKPLPIVPMVLVSTALEICLPRFFYWTFGSLMHSVEEINQWASVFGFAGATSFILFSNAVLARVLATGPRSLRRVGLRVLGVGVFWVAVWGWGAQHIRTFDAGVSNLKHTRIGYIQPNFTFSELSSNPHRPADAQDMSLTTLIRMSQEVVAEAPEKPDLIVWPESVVPFSFVKSERQNELVKDLAKVTNTPILVQATEMDDDEIERVGYRYATMYSASFVISPDGTRSPSFRKWYPIPFGETVPLESTFPFLGKLVRDNIGNTSKVGIGDSFDAIPYAPDLFVAPLICFDGIYPPLPRLETLKGRASVLVNQANFVWMDVSDAGLQFRELDRFRAIENGRSMLMVSNTGPTVAFDPLGRPLSETTPLMSQSKGSIVMPVNTEFTPYSRFGDTPLLSFGVLSLIYLLKFVRQKEERRI